MTLENVLPVVVFAIVVLASLAKHGGKLKRGFNSLVEQQRVAERDRVLEIKAEMERRGVAVPQALAALSASFEAAALAQRGASAEPHSQPAQGQQQHRRHKQQPPPSPAAPPPRVTVPVGPPVELVAAAPGGMLRGMLAEAFGDPAHARNAVILAEILAKPVALR
ncbi:MAG: hypothetical protein JWO66_261 [Candidatus Eremiobacteraeota bacterium]|nr:hypothetical protein [Candidatus Eremiobacteraeota bacterium]